MFRAHNGRRPRRTRIGSLGLGLAVAMTGVQFALVTPAAAAVGFESPGSSVVENNIGRTRMTFTVTRAPGDPLSIDYRTEAGTATAGSDYVETDGTMVFDNAQTSRALTVDVLGDMVDEDDETFSLVLSDDRDDLATATATIIDNDPLPTVSIEDAPLIDEDDTGTKQASFYVSLSRPSGRTVTVNYATSDGTALAGADYTATTGSVAFSPGQTSATAQVPVIGDVVDEIDETFTVALSLPAGDPTAAIGDGTGVGTIRDDDGLPSVSINSVTVGEADGTATFTVTLSPASGKTVKVKAGTSNGTATAGSDFTHTSKVLEIPPGATSVPFAVPILDDAAAPVAEPSETFLVTLSEQDNALLGDFLGTGTITDNDAGPTLSVSDVTQAEGDLVTTAFQFKVTRTGATTKPVSFRYETVNGTASADTSPADFIKDSGEVLMVGPETTVTVLVTADTLAEADETFTLRLTHATNAGIADGDGLGTILNDDGPPGILAVNDVSISEGGTEATFTISVVRAVNKVMTVQYTTQNGTALHTEDYTRTLGALTFAANSSTAQTVKVPITDDGIDEHDETFTLELSNPVNAIFENGDSSGTGTITDNDDEPVFSVTVPDPGIAEGGSGDVRVKLSAQSGKEVKVTVTLADDSALAGVDYAPLTQTLTFSPGETAKDVAVQTSADEIDEIDEVFRAQLSAAVNATVPDALAGPGQAVTIVDNDAPPAVRVSDAVVEENEGSITFAVTLDAPSGKAVTVDAETADDTATVADNDYDAASATLSFAAGETSETFVVNLTDDGDDESDEAFTVTLSDPVNATLASDGTSATGTILDDDGPPSFSVTGTGVAEDIAGGQATVTVRVLPFNNTGGNITVQLATGNGSALAPADYLAKAATVSFGPGESTKTIAIDVVDDTADEVDETFVVRLSDNMPPSPTTEIGGAEATLTITDDDGPLISAAGFSFTEGDSGLGSATFVVSLSAASPQTVQVAYATTGGTATAPSDFVSVAGNLTFAPGETTKPVAVEIAGDTLDEADEEFFLTLSGAVNGTAGPPAKAVIIDDDQPDVSVGAGGADTPPAGDPVVTEGDFGVRTMTFAVRPSEATARDVIVDYSLGAGTASAVADYERFSGRLTFAPGEVVKEVVVPIKGDSLFEVDETVVLSITGTENGTVVDTTSVGTIVDDDEPGYTFVATDGGVFTFGDADFAGSTGDMVLNKPIVGMAAHPSGRGYWLVASDGGVFAFGEAPYKGSTGNMKLNRAIVGMAAHPSGDGYWLVAEDGGIFAFGSAEFWGSTGAMVLNRPIVGMAVHPSGDGYWLVASDGGIFAFNAPYHGSTGAITLNKPIVGMAAHPSGDGYWLVASDGGIFAFNAPFLGSTGAITLNKPIVGMAAHPSGDGYWLVASDGGVFSFNAPFLGSTGNMVLNKPVKGMATL